MSEKGGKGASLLAKSTTLKSSIKTTAASLKGKEDHSAKPKKGRKVHFGTEADYSSPKSDRKFATPFGKDWGKGGKGEKVTNAGKTSVAKESKTLDLRAEQELPENVKCLIDCEAANILEGIHEQMVLLSQDSAIKLPVSFDSGLQYAKNGSSYTNPQSVRRMLEALSKYGVSNSEICVLANACPETIDEVFALVRSLGGKRTKLSEPFKDVLDELAKLKKST